MAAADLASLAAGGANACSLGLLPSLHSTLAADSQLKLVTKQTMGGVVPPSCNGSAYERLGRSCSSVILPGVPGAQLPSPPPGAIQHKSKKQSVTLISAEHFIHIPRHFFQTNFDIPQILKNGLHVQVRPKWDMMRG